MSIGVFYVIKIERSLFDINKKISKINFYSKKDLKEIRAIHDKNLKDSLLDVQTIMQIRGSVDAHVENTVDVNLNNY